MLNFVHCVYLPNVLHQLLLMHLPSYIGFLIKFLVLYIDIVDCLQLSGVPSNLSHAVFCFPGCSTFPGALCSN